MPGRLRSFINFFRRPKTPLLPPSPPLSAPPPSLSSPDDGLRAALRGLLALGSPSRQEWTPHRFTIPAELEGVSLAQAMATKFDLPKSYLQKLVARHEVQVERLHPDTNQHVLVRYGTGLKVQSGDKITITGAVLPEKKEGALSVLDWRMMHNATAAEQREAVRSLVIYEDDRIVVLNKPHGICLQRRIVLQQPPNVTLEQLINDHLGSDYKLVHRLEPEATGVLVVAKDPTAAARLCHILHPARIDPKAEKIYWALTLGKPEMARGEIFSNVYCASRFPEERLTSHWTLRQHLTDRGQPAISQWRHLGTYVKKHVSGKKIYLSMLEFRVITDRKHQVRLHCAEQLGMPIVGDAKYGFDQMYHAQIGPRPLHLHCYQVRLRDWNGPKSDLVLTAPVPAHFVRSMDEYKLFLRKRPKLKRPKVKSNVRRFYQRFLN